MIGEYPAESEFENVLISLFAAAALFLKQFYFGMSGTLQMGDIVLLLAAFMCVKKNGIAIEEEDKPLLVFLFFVVIINALHSVFDGIFYSSSIFWIFNFIIIVFLFRPMLQVDGFLESVRFAFRAVLITQLLIYIAGAGWLEGGRYLGTFNDPNQFGFYVLCSMMGQYAIDVIQKKKTNWLWIIVAFFEITISQSSGMLLGIVLFLTAYLFVATTQDKGMQRIYLFILICVFMIAVAFVFRNSIVELLTSLDNDALNRKLPKIASDGYLNSYLKDRILQRTIKAPWNFIYGCGEGNFERFRAIEGYSKDAVLVHEMHSTMLALPYYYGLFPFCFVLLWLYYNLHHVNHRIFPVYFALILEAFTLANHRQYVFWLLFMLASHKDAKE